MVEETLTDYDRKALKGMSERYKPGEVFDINDAKDPVRASLVWERLERLGYVTISDTARCGFERIPGRFVGLTQAGRDLARDNI